MPKSAWIMKAQVPVGMNIKIVELPPTSLGMRVTPVTSVCKNLVRDLRLPKNVLHPGGALEHSNLY